MDLRLKGPRRTLRIESVIEGFENIVRRTTEFAPDNGIELSAATRANLKAMGLGEPRSNPLDDAANMASRFADRA
jgi:hypothetical protein